MRFAINTLPAPENKPSGVCSWRGCYEPSQTLEGTNDTTLWCKEHRVQVDREWQEVLARSPGYRAYYEGKED